MKRSIGRPTPQKSPWRTPKRLKGLDGRGSIALIKATHWWGTSVVLNRRIVAASTTWTLHAYFSELELYRSRKQLELSTLSEITAVAALILAVDAEQMLRRAAELPHPPTVQIHFDKDGVSDDVRSFFIEPIRNLLRDQAICINPLDWRGSQAIILA